jgi:hypothetical protein
MTRAVTRNPLATLPLTWAKTALGGFSRGSFALSPTVGPPGTAEAPYQGRGASGPNPHEGCAGSHQAMIHTNWP